MNENDQFAGDDYCAYCGNHTCFGECEEMNDDCELCGEENDVEDSHICSDCDFLMNDDDGQPTEYEEWQDLYGGDDWDHGQYDCCEDW